MSGFQGISGKMFNQYDMLQFNIVEAVVVSGDGPNVCGHIMPRVEGYYFHA